MASISNRNTRGSKKKVPSGDSLFIGVATVFSLLKSHRQVQLSGGESNRFLLVVLALLAFLAVPLLSTAEVAKCRAYDLGDIDVKSSSAGISGIVMAAWPPGASPDSLEVFLIADNKNALYQARLQENGWTMETHSFGFIPQYGHNRLNQPRGPGRETTSDIEDLAYGPCPTGGGEEWCLIAGAIGGNRQKLQRGRSEFWIHFVPQGLTFDPPPPRKYAYADSGYDAEALAASPTGELFITTKTRGRLSCIYKLDPLGPDGIFRKVATIDLEKLFSPFGGNTNVRQITGMDILSNGTKFVIVTYEALAWFDFDLRKARGKEFASADGLRAIDSNWWGRGTPTGRPQVEAISYYRDDESFLIMGENIGKHANGRTLIGVDCAQRRRDRFWPSTARLVGAATPPPALSTGPWYCWVNTVHGHKACTCKNKITRKYCDVHGPDGVCTGSDVCPEGWCKAQALRAPSPCPHH